MEIDDQMMSGIGDDPQSLHTTQDSVPDILSDFFSEIYFEPTLRLC